MLKQIVLLTPIYVTVFWAITLNSGCRKNHNPRIFLAKFMALTVFIYLSHYLYYYPSYNLYPYIDPLYQYASLLAFPLYHIYIRLLTVEDDFSLKKHVKFLIAPTLLFLLYLIGVLLSGFDNFKMWICDMPILINNSAFVYLSVVLMLIKITFVVQIIATLIGNYILIHKYDEQTKRYFSDMDNNSSVNVKILNASMIVTGLVSLIVTFLDRRYFEDKFAGMLVASIIFSSMLFVIGWLGNRQKSVNPSLLRINHIDDTISDEGMINACQQKLMDKVNALFVEKRVFMNSSLNIQDVAQAVGSNRTYISSLINQRYNQNFCTFVNNYRIEELEKVLKENPDYTSQLLAESCGFGSVDSMRRAVAAKSQEHSFNLWKMKVLKKY